MYEKNLRVGITGESGFIGRRLAQVIDGEADLIRVPFEDGWFEDAGALEAFAAACDVIVHLAARNRPTDDPAVFETNVRLTKALIRAFEHTESQPIVAFASSIREGEATAYGRSKKACREMLEAWAAEGGGRLAALRIPNVFGAGARPFDNSFIATFSRQLIRGEVPVVTENRVVPLVHVDSLARQIVTVIRNAAKAAREGGVEADLRMPVAEVLEALRGFWSEYQKTGNATVPKDRNLANLRETFMSYLD